MVHKRPANQVLVKVSDVDGFSQGDLVVSIHRLHDGDELDAELGHELGGDIALELEPQQDLGQAGFQADAHGSFLWSLPGPPAVNLSTLRESVVEWRPVQAAGALEYINSDSLQLPRVSDDMDAELIPEAIRFLISHGALPGNPELCALRIFHNEANEKLHRVLGLMGKGGLASCSSFTESHSSWQLTLGCLKHLRVGIRVRNMGLSGIHKHK